MINIPINQDVKYSSTQYIVPGSIPALCFNLNLDMIFYLNQDFSGPGVVVDVCVWIKKIIP